MVGRPRRAPGQFGILSAADLMPAYNSRPPGNVTTLASFTSPGLIVPQLRGRDSAAVIGELGSRLQGEDRLNDPLSFYNAAMSREWLSSTAMAPGWALPHARMKGLPQLAFALGRSTEALNWPGAGGVAVRLVFLFAVPEADGASYLTLISGLAKLSRDPARCQSLLQAPDPQAIFEVLQQVPLAQLSSAPARNQPESTYHTA